MTISLVPIINDR